MNPADVYLEAVNVSFGEAHIEGMPPLTDLIETWDKSDHKKVDYHIRFAKILRI